MIARFTALALLWGGAGAAAVASTSPLREIGHVGRTYSACANVVVHANAAIAASLRDDDAIARASAQLHGAAFEGNAPGKRSAVSELRRSAAELGESAMRGEDEVRRLLALAEAGPADRTSELRSFATALRRALERQGEIGDEIAAFVRTLDDRELRGSKAIDGDDASVGTRGMPSGLPPVRNALGERSQSPKTLARTLATGIERRTDEIARDETDAADRTATAVSGC